MMGNLFGLARRKRERDREGERALRQPCGRGATGEAASQHCQDGEAEAAGPADRPGGSQETVYAANSQDLD